MAIDFVKQVEDIKHGRIEDVYQAIIDTDLVYLPGKPVSAIELVDLNNAHRMQFGKKIYNFVCIISTLSSERLFHALVVRH